MASKENAITLPAALLLTEIIFFQKISLSKNSLLSRKSVSAVFTVFIVILIICYFMWENILAGLALYEKRDFTLTERLMTQPRILLYYLTQIFYPIADRLSVEHEVALSVSLFEPWTTLPAIVLVIMIIILGLVSIRKRPLLSFAILFYFTGHLVESTVLPLELFFEHRNYLPSFFLFLPIAAGCKKIIDYYDTQNSVIYRVIVSFLTVLVMLFGYGTYIRNMAWATQKSLWEDAMEKAPNQERPLTNLVSFFIKSGDLDKALSFSEKALQLQSHKKTNCKTEILSNIAVIYGIKKEYDKAEELSLRIIAQCTDYIEKDTRYNLILILTKNRLWQKAREQTDILISELGSYNPLNHKKYLNIAGLVYLNTGNPEQAFLYLKKALEKDPDYWEAIFNTGVSLSMQEKYSPADIYLKKAYRMDPKEILSVFKLIENNIKNRNPQNTEFYMNHLLSSFSIAQIKNELAYPESNALFVPVDKKLLAEIVSQKLEEYAKAISAYSYEE
ncbi:MAG: tetratricopeptide repeat protein [Desulfococcaceae bacterium]